MNLDDLTLGQIKEIQKMCGTNNEKNLSAYPVGKNVIVRTVTMIYTGRLQKVTKSDLVLTECSWIPETDRYMSFVAEGKVKECEPYPDELEVFVNRGALLDLCELTSTLPRSQK